MAGLSRKRRDATRQRQSRAAWSNLNIGRKLDGTAAITFVVPAEILSIQEFLLWQPRSAIVLSFNHSNHSSKKKFCCEAGYIGFVSLPKPRSLFCGIVQARYSVWRTRSY